MKQLIYVATSVLLVLFSTVRAGAEDGRTDGDEASEYGKGGYPFGGEVGQFYISPAFGSGIFAAPGRGSRSALLYGVDIGYERDGWIGIQAGYTYLPDEDLSIYSVGTRLAYATDPFVYYISTHAGLYAPVSGENRFGVSPGAGIDIVVNEKMRVGLNYRHDFVFADRAIEDIDRVYAGLKFYF